MAHWTRIAGVVTRGDAPVDRAYVTVRDADGNFTGEQRTPAGGEGRFAFNLGPGRWVLEAVAPGSALVRREVELAPGEQAEVTLELA